MHIWAVIASIHDFKKAQTFLALIGVCWVIAVIQLLSPHIGILAEKKSISTLRSYLKEVKEYRWTPIICGGVFIVCVAIFLAIDTNSDRSRLFGLVGMAFFVLFMAVISTDRSKINWRTVAWGFSVHFCFGVLCLRWTFGSILFQQFSETTVKFLELANYGSEFVYGFLSKPPPICQLNPVLVFSAFQVLVFFGSVVSLLYYYGIIQWVLKRMAYLMQLTLGTTAVESLNACACVFLGQSESALLVRPYLEKQTSSELHAIMASGFSCIAGSLFAAYVSFGACPKYLLSSSVMSAPASLAFAKIMVPETEESQSRKVSDLDLPPSEEDNPIESISNGAIAGIHIVVAIAANLVAVLALLALVDSILFYFGDLIGYRPWSLENLLQYLMFPVAFVMGVTGDTQETLAVARLIATKTAVNEFVAYRNLGEMISDESLHISPRSAMMATYALCSFSNLGSVGIVMGVLGGMVPTKRHILARMVFRALICGCVCCLYTAALAEFRTKVKLNAEKYAKKPP
nr:Na dependent nucleoside transporter and Nucleoside recognition domain containing protein [Haemonchus contortus]